MGGVSCGLGTVGWDAKACVNHGGAGPTEITLQLPCDASVNEVLACFDVAVLAWLLADEIPLLFNDHHCSELVHRVDDPWHLVQEIFVRKWLVCHHDAMSYVGVVIQRMGRAGQNPARPISF
jgi:hypothetical protein